MVIAIRRTSPSSIIRHHHPIHLIRLFTSTTANTSNNSAMPELTPSTINQTFIKTQYAVRGELAIKAERYRDELKAGGEAAKKLPFEKVVTANIGNPQQRGLDQKPLTFGRQVRFAWCI